MDSRVRESLIFSFMALGLTREEAAIAAGLDRADNLANTHSDLGEIFEPIGRGGYREF